MHSNQASSGFAGANALKRCTDAQMQAIKVSLSICSSVYWWIGIPAPVVRSERERRTALGGLPDGAKTSFLLFIEPSLRPSPFYLSQASIAAIASYLAFSSLLFNRPTRRLTHSCGDTCPTS